MKLILKWWNGKKNHNVEWWNGELTAISIWWNVKMKWYSFCTFNYSFSTHWKFTNWLIRGFSLSISASFSSFLLSSDLCSSYSPSPTSPLLYTHMSKTLSLSLSSYFYFFLLLLSSYPSPTCTLLFTFSLS